MSLRGDIQKYSITPTEKLNKEKQVNEESIILWENYT